MNGNVALYVIAAVLGVLVGVVATLFITRRPTNLPDLVVLQTAAGYCDIRPTGPDGSIPSIFITVKNQGTGMAQRRSVAQVVFPARQNFPGAPPRQWDVPALASGGQYEEFVQIPPGAFVPDLVFMITVDVNNDLTESDKANNSVIGVCVG